MLRESQRILQRKKNTEKNGLILPVGLETWETPRRKVSTAMVVALILDVQIKWEDTKATRDFNKLDKRKKKQRKKQKKLDLVRNKKLSQLWSSMFLAELMKMMSTKVLISKKDLVKSE